MINIDNQIYPIYYVSTFEVMKHMLGTVLAFIFFFSFNESYFNFSHLTTMTEEHLNGLLRVMAHFKYDLHTTETSIAECNITLKIHGKYDIEWRTHSRDYQTGVTYKRDCYTKEALLEKNEIASLVDWFFAAVKKQKIEYKGSRQHYEKLINYLNKLMPYHAKVEISKHISNPLSGISIFARLNALKNVFPKHEGEKAKGVQDLNPETDKDPVPETEESRLARVIPPNIIFSPNIRTDPKKFDKFEALILKRLAHFKNGVTYENFEYALKNKHPKELDALLKTKNITEILRGTLRKLAKDNEIQYCCVTTLYFPVPKNEIREKSHN